MTKPKIYFRYCSACGNKFIPTGKDGKKCKRCKDKMRVLMRLQNIEQSLNRIINFEKNISLLDFKLGTQLDINKKSEWYKNLFVILKSVDKSSSLLKKELKLK